nr:hypothetical protein [Candidatus Gastranaerophilales bacterium]
EIPKGYEIPEQKIYPVQEKYDPTTMMIGRTLTAITAAILLYSFLGDAGYQLSHLSAKVSEYKTETINPKQECLQENLETPKQIEIGQGKTHRILLKQAKYSLSGIVVAKNRNFWLRGFMQNVFDEVVPIDFGIAWGELADIPTLKKFKIKSSKTLGEARMLRYQWRLKDVPQNPDYVFSHISHNHIIPATDNVASALLKVKKWDTIKLDGYLVDIVQPNGYTSMTSLSRSDTNPTSRGAEANRQREGGYGGACEIFYVTGIQIRNKYYK